MRLSILMLLSPALSVALSGCSTAPPDAGFADINTVAIARSAHSVEWRGETAEDQAVDRAIAQLLRKDLTIDQAAQIALLNNRNLQATFEELGIAQADLVQAGLLKNPIFSAELRFPGKALEVDLIQDVLDLILIPLRKRVAESQFEATKLRVSDAVINIWTETRSAYYSLQAAEQMHDLRRWIVRTTEASADAARKLHDAGNLKDVEFANEQALYEQAKIELSRVEGEVLEHRERLNALMGLWGADVDRWSVSPRLPDLPQNEVAPTGLESLAVAQRLDLAAARQDIESLARSYGLIRSTALIPEINVGVHDEREPEGQNTLGPSIDLPLPIFNQGQATVARAKAQLRQAQQHYAALAVQIRSQVRTARNRMFNARSRAEYYHRVLVPLRHQIVEQTQLEYNAMLVGVFQLLQAKQNEIEAGGAYVEALQDYWSARAALEKAVGGRLGTNGPATQPASRPVVPATQQQTPAAHEHHHGG